MLLKPGKTVDEAIKFFEALNCGGLNDCRNEMPDMTDALFPSRMNNVIRKYTQWTDKAMRQIRQVVADPAVAARQKERFKGYGARALVVDTNTLLHCQRFDYIPWRSLYGKDARLAIPHVVVDEIDRKSYGEGGRSRSERAAYTR